MKSIIFFLLLLFVISCSTTSYLNKYKGSDIAAIKKEFGEPTTIIPTSTGSIYIYETTKTLRSTEISKGQTTLDPMVSPAATKTEKIIFTVTKGKIEKIKKEIEYTRR